MTNSRALATTALEVTGLCVVAVGCWLLLPAAGVIAAGLALVLVGWRSA